MIPLSDEATPQLARGPKSDNAAPSGHHPIALASITLIAFVAAITTIALWRAYAGTSPELDRGMAARQLQARAGQASQELIEKTKGIEATQQEWIEQLLVMQDQLQSMRRLLTAQQAESKRLSEQVATLTEAIDGLRQSFANPQASDARHPASEASQDATGRTR